MYEIKEKSEKRIDIFGLEIHPAHRNNGSMKVGPLQEQSYSFSLKIIDVSRKLQSQHEYVLGRQLLKSGTSIGANIEESQLAQSKNDFISKISIAAKEAYETRYWLRLLRDSKLLNTEESQRLLSDLEEIIRMLVSTLKTSRG